MSQSEENQDDYSLVVLSKVNPERELPTDIYLLLDGKFIKFKEKGDYISAKKYDYFISKGLTNLYIKNDELMDFLAWISETNQNEIESLIDATDESNRETFEKNEQVRERVYETFLGKEINEEVVDKLQSNVSEFIEHVREDSLTAEAIQALSLRDKNIVDHSVNVANLSVYLAMALGYGHQDVLENIYLGSIFHDYGKAKIPRNVLENKDTQKYQQSIVEHPEKSLKIIRKTKGIPEAVYQIIFQHHEQCNGEGYPMGLKGEEINEFAQIVSLANVFHNILEENRHLLYRDQYKMALTFVSKNIGRHWNPKYFPRAMEALNIAFGRPLKSLYD